MQQVLNYPNINVMYLESDSGVAGAENAFTKLEAKLGSIKGRKFYGLMFGIPPNETYWASVVSTPEDEPDELGLKTYTIPAGKYVQKIVKNWYENKPLIEETFKTLAAENQVDTTRPSIEFYRSMAELVCRVPIK